jgi:hypothetical protein
MKTNFRLPFPRGGARRLLAWFLIVTVLGTTPIAYADGTLTEMLELGIYSEETKGDLPAAIALYAQIVEEADANQALAAQAQFRLATCLHKQGDYAAATAAFEKLVRDFASQKDLVTLAKEYLAEGAALLPEPWVDGEEMQYAIRLPSGIRVGLARRSVHADMRDGRKIWRFQGQARAGGNEWSRVEVDAETFKPIECHWKINVMGEAHTTYTETGAETRLKGTTDLKHVTFDGPVYDNEQAFFLLRRLPLADGYETTFKVHSGLSGMLIDLPVRVSGPSPITVPAGDFSCFKVVLKVFQMEQVFWISDDAHRHLVKLEANGAVLELLRTVNVAAAQPVVYHDDMLNFSLTAPAGWMMERVNPTDTSESNVMLLDPHGTALAQLSVENVDHFAPDVSASAGNWADYKIKQISQRVSRFDLVPDARREFTVDGGPAVSIVADVVQAPLPQPQRMFGVYALNHGNTVEIWCATAPEEFEAFQPVFADIVASYRGQ